MRYCTECGKQLSENMRFCTNCGTKVEAVAQKTQPVVTTPVQNAPVQNYSGQNYPVHNAPIQNVPVRNYPVQSYPVQIESTPAKQKTKNKRGMGVIGTIAVLLAIVLIVTLALHDRNGDSGLNADKPSTSTNETVSPPINVIIDVEKFGNISGSELIALIGEPDDISQSACQGAFDIPCVYYDYNNADTLGEVSFVLVNDQVVRLTSYSTYSFEGQEAVLAQFGITKESSCAVFADTGVALRYRCPSAKVDDFWINLIDGSNFGYIQVTYDMEYYEEWYLPLTSSEEIEYKTNAESIMKTLLTLPNTAKFPLYDWVYGKNLFYIGVSSYVDSENAFGVEVRSTFNFVYSRITGELVLAIVNDEVIADNGYVETSELIQQLYEEMEKTAVENESDTLVVTVEELVKDIESDIDAAKEKYNGKTIQITGKVLSAYNVAGMTSFYLYGTKGGSSLRIICWVNYEVLKPFDYTGETHTFIGQVREITTVNATEIGDCWIISD